jgi:integrase
MVLLQTGLREREAMPLEWTDINWEMKTLKVQSKIKWKTAPPEIQSTAKRGTKVKRYKENILWESRIKTWEQREQGLSDDLLKRLKEYQREHGGESTLIFGKRMQKGPMKGLIMPDGHLLRTLKQQVRAAGLNCGECEGCRRLNITPPKKRRGEKLKAALPSAECEKLISLL